MSNLTLEQLKCIEDAKSLAALRERVYETELDYYFIAGECLEQLSCLNPRILTHLIKCFYQAANDYWEEMDRLLTQLSREDLSSKLLREKNRLVQQRSHFLTHRLRVARKVNEIIQQCIHKL